MSDMMKQARKANARVKRAKDTTAAATADLHRLCAELNDAGVTIQQIATGLGVTRRNAQRYVEAGRVLRRPR